MKQETVKFDVDLMMRYGNDEDPDFAVMSLEFLSDGYNSHDIPVTTEILKRDAQTILGKVIVAKYNELVNDVRGHETDEVIVGYVPQTAQITFKHTVNGLFACVDGLISKLYAADVYELYKVNNERAVSVEMSLRYKDEAEDELESLCIHGVTLLGLDYNPSCTLAKSNIVRFSLDEANSFYEQLKLEDYVERRKTKMEGKTYKVDTSELKSTPWGDVDKTKLRNTIMSASNRASLVKKVYLDVESGWEEAPSEKLHYPVMELVGDTFYYNRYGLASAMAYAKQHNETQIVSKLKKLYKQFDLEDGKEGEEDKMAEDIKKKLEEEKLEVEPEEKKEDQEPEEKLEEKLEDDSDDEDEKEEEETKMSEDEMLAEIDSLKASLVEKDEIIMGQNTELEELRQFKENIEQQSIKATVDETMCDLQGKLEQEVLNSLQEEGMACKMSELDGWKNRVKAMAFDAIPKDDNSLWRIGAPQKKEQKPKGLWD